MSDSDSLIGRVIGGKYQVTLRTADESLGRAYQATADGVTAVRLKVLDPRLLGDLEGTARFGREMLATGSVSHPNTLKMLDFGEDGKLSYYVTESLAGRSLETLMEEQGALSVDRAVHIGAQIAAALDAVHDKSIIHRNLSAKSVVLLDNAEGDYVKVCDFGMSWLEDYRAADDGRITRFEDQLGHIDTMAPEYISDRIVGPRGDLYALGVMLFQMVTGEPPFTGTAGLVLHAHLHTEAPRLSDRAAVPDWLDELVASLLAKAMDERPASARAVVDALEAGAGHTLEPPPLRTDPGVVHTARPARKKARKPARSGALPLSPMWVGASLGLLIGVGLLLAWWFGS